jgi:ferredoxin-NADP reductase
MTRRRRAQLVEVSELSPSVKSLTFAMREGSHGSPVGHVAGQHVDLIVPTPHGLAFRRSYSIASAADTRRSDRFEVAVTRVEGGPTSSALHGLEAGAWVDVEGPRGTFVRAADDLAHPALFVATGTGLAPVRAMLQEETRRPQGPPLVVLFGCRTPADRLWHEELQRFERDCPRLSVTTTLSRPPLDWSGATGYVQRHVVALAHPLTGVRAYVCGLSAMVDDVVRILTASGIPHERVRYELYD